MIQLFTINSSHLCFSVLALAAITKYHTLGGLNNEFLFSHNSGGWKSKIRGLTRSLSGEGSLPGLQKTPCSPRAHRTSFAVHAHTRGGGGGKKASCLMSPLLRARIPPGQGPALMTSSPSTSQRPHPQKASHWVLGQGVHRFSIHSTP